MFNPINMGRIRAFYLAYSIYPQAVGKLEGLRCPTGSIIIDEIEAELSTIPTHKAKKVKKKKEGQ